MRWRSLEGDGIEHLVLEEGPDGILADSVLLATEGGQSFAIRYKVSCDAGWHVRRLEVELVGHDHGLVLNGDGQGGWTDGSGLVQPHLRGAIDVDLSGSPFTNTLPIRRLDPAAGASEDILVVYVSLPGLEVTTDPQRYTCLDPRRLYRYEALDNDFTRDIEVDERGFVVAYPGLFARLL